MRSRRRNRRRRRRRGGKGKGAYHRKSSRHGRTQEQMRLAASRRQTKKTSGNHSSGNHSSGNHSPGWKSGKGQVAAWRTNWKQTKKRSRLGAPPTGRAPPPPSAVVKAGQQAANVAANKVVSAVTSAANTAASCPPGCIPTMAGAGRRNYAKPRPGTRRRRRHTRRR